MCACERARVCKEVYACTYMYVCVSEGTLMCVCVSDYVRVCVQADINTYYFCVCSVPCLSIYIPTYKIDEIFSCSRGNTAVVPAWKSWSKQVKSEANYAVKDWSEHSFLAPTGRNEAVDRFTRYNHPPATPLPPPATLNTTLPPTHTHRHT